MNNLFIFNDGKRLITKPGEEINTPLDGLLVALTDPQDGQTIKYNGSMWVNGEGGGGASGELIKTITFDKNMISDNLIQSLPGYSTSEQTLLNTSDIDTSLTLDPDTYDYYVLERALTIPAYSIDTVAEGREDASFASGLYQVCRIPKNTYKSIINPSKSAPANNNSLVVAAEVTSVMGFNYNGSSSIDYSISYGLVTKTVSPTLHYSTSVLTIKSPLYTVKGAGSFLNSTYYAAITDIRVQYVIEVYRAAKNSLDWTNKGQLLKIADALASASHDLG